MPRSGTTRPEERGDEGRADDGASGPVSPPAKPGRLVSLDAFRGLTIAAMILVNNPGSWGHVYPPLRHAAWHGCTPTDLIFPFFLFIMGVAAGLGLPSKRGDGRALRRALRRSAVLVGLGLALNATGPILSAVAGDATLRDAILGTRVPGVLQRIGLRSASCWA